ncbi:MAG: hypothetical protein JOZ41_17340 [Chloroflexi bacterium]|nr:hypothetical protein [Chloroflexota bacterium]
MADHNQRLDEMMGKAQDALGKFLDDQEKVDRTKAKAEDILARKLGHEQASQLVDKAEDLLERFARHPDDEERNTER